MAHREAYFVIEDWVKGEKLRLDGSNFPSWLVRLNDLLTRNHVVDYIGRTMDLTEPDHYETPEELADRYYRQEMSTYIQIIMRYGMVDELHPLMGDLDPYSMVDQLRAEFISHARMWKNELLGEFLSIKMEEHTCLKSHLERMLDAHMRLVHFVDYWMDDPFAIDVLLRSLPPSYEGHVRSSIMSGDTETLDFHEFILRFRNVKVEPITGGVIDDEGIYLIYSFINVIILQTHLQC